MKYFHRQLFLTFLLGAVISICQGQDTGFNAGGKEAMNPIYRTELFIAWSDSVLSSANGIPLVITSDSREIVRHAGLTIKIDESLVHASINDKGFYYIPIVKNGKSVLIDIKIKHPEFHEFDTSFVWGAEQATALQIDLRPRYLILVRGRVMAHNVPLEGATVGIQHLSDTIQTKTLGCYYDEEGYYNCLYDGMFKERIATDNPNDSIFITIRKDGFVPLRHTLVFKEYNGEIMEYKLRYADRLPEVYKNNLALKLTVPLISDDSWFAALSYIRGLNIGGFDRIGLGAEASVLIKDHTETYPTYQGHADAKTDSSYLVGFAGPTIFFWITNPLQRRYSIYAGNTFAYEFNTSFISLQPFLGCRFFLDLNKAISFDIRYLNYEIDAAKYEFNLYGQATQHIERVKFSNDILISLGFHIGF